MVQTDSQQGTDQPRSIRRNAVLLFIVVFLSMQVIVPVVQLAGSRPERFGWQMFSSARQHPEYSLVMANGETRAVDIREYFGHLRSEMEFEQELPAHLCETHSEAIAIRIDSDDAAQSDEWPCP